MFDKTLATGVILYLYKDRKIRKSRSKRYQNIKKEYTYICQIGSLRDNNPNSNKGTKTHRICSNTICWNYLFRNRVDIKGVSFKHLLPNDPISNMC